MAEQSSPTGAPGSAGHVGTADLLVVGALRRRDHSALRRRDHSGLQLGRVGHAVLHHSACPVAIVPRQT
ncbi:universal stress protein [Streptomyces sp. S465]|uniref:universal stress protein n=1 Tax=Streptomyces sp. S465 TaxID=2979468 RepID=UPI003FCC8077